MKIAVFYHLPPGGAKRTVYEQVKGLSVRHQVEVYEITPPEPQFLDVHHLSVPVFSYYFTLQNNFSRIISRLVSDYRNFYSLANLHRKIASDIDSKKYDVVLVHPDLLTESPFVLKYLKTPTVYYCHELLRIGYEPELAFTQSVIWPKKLYENLTRKIRITIDKTNARCADKIITNSRFIQNKIRLVYGRDSQICYLGVDTQIFHPSTPKKRQIIFMGQKNHLGGYDFITQIMQQIPAKFRPNLINFGFPKGQPDLVNDAILAKNYAESLVSICASISEPFGLKALESMACGTPVLAVSEGGYPESVIHDKTGWVYPRDPQIFARKIIDLVKHPALSSKFGSTARTEMLNHWTWTRHISELDQILSHVA